MEFNYQSSLSYNKCNCNSIVDLNECNDCLELKCVSCDKMETGLCKLCSIYRSNQIISNN